MGKNDEREAFRQAALKMAKYRLRKVMNDAGCTPQEIREAEVEGEDRMIDIIMTKYDEGAIDLPGLERAKGGGGGGNSSAAKEEPKKEQRKAKREEKKSTKKSDKDDDDDPYSSAFGDDDDDDGPHSDDDEDDKVSAESKAQEDDDVENHEADPPRKAGRKAQRTEEPASDLSAIEEKLDKLLDVTVSSIETSLETRTVLDQHVASSNLFHEIVKMAFSRIWKLGAANPLKPGFGDVIKKARSVLGLPEEDAQRGD